MAVAHFNGYRGGVIYIDFRSAPNHLVYRKGQLIAETTIQGGITRDEAQSAIASYVSGEFSQRLLRDGMIPVMGEDESLGEIPTDELLVIIDEISRQDRKLRLLFHADRDTRVGDKLQISMDLRT